MAHLTKNPLEEELMRGARMLAKSIAPAVSPPPPSVEKQFAVGWFRIGSK
jgi:hypothetical protein